MLTHSNFWLLRFTLTLRVWGWIEGEGVADRKKYHLWTERVWISIHQFCWEENSINDILVTSIHYIITFNLFYLIEYLNKLNKNKFHSFFSFDNKSNKKIEVDDKGKNHRDEPGLMALDPIWIYCWIIAELEL